MLAWAGADPLQALPAALREDRYLRGCHMGGDAANILYTDVAYCQAATPAPLLHMRCVATWIQGRHTQDRLTNAAFHKTGVPL